MICHYCLVKRYCLTPLKYTPTTTALRSIRNTVSHTNNRRCHTNNFAPRPRWFRSEANSSRCHSEIIISLELPAAMVLLFNGQIRKRNYCSQMLKINSTGKIKMGLREFSIPEFHSLEFLPRWGQISFVTCTVTNIGVDLFFSVR